MIRRGSRPQSYEPVSAEEAIVSDTRVRDTSKNEDYSSENQPPAEYLGKPSQKPLLNTTDCIAVLVSLACLAASACTILPSLSIAARLQYTGQIVVLGFLLGVMNQCLLRVIPHMILLIEARFGSSSLQNFDGILRWAPLAEGLSLVWRATLITLLVLPLALGVLYKRFTGGISTVNMTSNGTLYTPTIPYGLENVGPLSAIANSTGPFMAASVNETVPNLPQHFGHNIIVLTTASAVAIDAPNQLYVQQLQSELAPEEHYTLTAKVRGTVATYNDTAESHREDEAFWDKYLSLDNIQYSDLLDPGETANTMGLLNKRVATSDAAEQWNTSWIFLALYIRDGTTEDQADRLGFTKAALGFDVKHHDCLVTWQITRSSMELIDGDCDLQPLDWQYQYLENSQNFLQGSTFLPIAAEYLSPFTASRSLSPWRIPTFAVVTATIFWSRIALRGGWVWIQSAGPLEAYWLSDNFPNNPVMQTTVGWNETYALNHTLQRFVPTLDPAPSLYLVLAIYPLMTITVFLIVLLMYKTPIGKGFGIVSILAGVDRDSLGPLSGASFSGSLSRPIGMGIRVRNGSPAHENVVPRLEYVFGEKGNKGSLKFGTKYH